MKKSPCFLLTALLVLAAMAAAPAPASGGALGIGQWSPLAERGFGAGKANAAAGPMAVYKGALYSAVSNDEGAVVKRLSGSKWSNVSSAGFGSGNNKAITSLSVYGDHLYAGTTNTTSGLEVWRYDGHTWSDALTGFGQAHGFGSASNVGATAMAVFGEGDGYLFVGTTNYRLNIFSPGSDGAEVWYFDGAAWTRSAEGGFGDELNMGVASLKQFKGSLYAGTMRAELTIKIMEGKAVLTSKGCELRKLSGAAWSRVAGNGFTDRRNIAAVGLEVYGSKLMIGTANGDGTATFDIMEMKLSDYTYETNGLCVYSYDGKSVRSLVEGGFSSTDEFAVSCFESLSLEGGTILLAGVARTEGAALLKVYDGADWFDGAAEGMGNPENTGITSILASGGSACVGTANGKQGCEVWRGTPPASREDLFKTWYLAEGSTNGGFETWVLVQNPGAEEAKADITYMTPQGEVPGPSITLPPQSRQTLNVADTVNGEWSVSTKVSADHAVVAERAVYWNNRKAGHDSIGVTEPSGTWYLAEGSTNGGFETWVLVQNPGSEEAEVQLSYMTPAGQKEGPKVTLEPMSRQSLNVADTVSGEWSVSTKVSSDQPVIAERAVYWNNRAGGHDSIGVTEPAGTWYLAEGSTNGGFETWVLVQNPGTQPASVTLTYMTGTGEKAGPTFSLAPESRQSLNVADNVSGAWSVSTKVSSDQPVIAERAVYWNNRVEGHDSIGASVPATEWYLAEGSTNGGFETWVLVQNPGTQTATVKFTYMTTDGEVPGPSVELKASTRQTINVADTVNGEWSVSTKVESDRPVIAERAVYWENRRGGHESIGATF